MPARPSTWKMLLYVTSMAVIVQFAGDNFLPSLPAITTYFNISQSLTQYSVTLYLLGGAICQFFYGPLSDVFGRKRAILTGYSIFTLGSVFCFCAPSIYWLLVGRIIQGMGIACTGLFRSVMRDFYEGKDLAKIGAVVSIAATMTPPLAPITGGYLEYYFGWRASFVLLFLMGFSSIIFFALYFPESLHLEKRRKFSFAGILRNYRECFLNRCFFSFSVASGLCLGLIFAYMTVGTFLYQHVFGLSAVAYGWLAIFGVFFMPLGAYLNRLLMDKYPVHCLTVWAAGLILFGSLLLFVFAWFQLSHIAMILIPVFIVYMGMGCVFPNSFTQAFEEFGHIAGVAGAAFGAIQIFTSALLSGIAAELPADSVLPLSLFFLVVSLVLWLTVKFAKKISI
ncbi:MAG: multidrug effflux MFS transporter [Gammaproteobacteria bacterium]|nr:multidrug effflux MFS transporter [Gammaproteobacteria bacterium]